MSALDEARGAFTAAAEHIAGDCRTCRPGARLPQLCPVGQVLITDVLSALVVVPPADPFGPAAAAYLIESTRQAVAGELVRFADAMEAHQVDDTRARRDAWWVRYASRIAADGLAAHLLAIRAPEQQEYVAELERLREAVLVAEADRDTANEWTDSFARAVAPLEELRGPHGDRCPWDEALALVRSDADVRSLTRRWGESVGEVERLSALLELRAEQGAVVTIPAAEVWKLRQEVTQLRARVEELTEQRDDALVDIATAPEPEPEPVGGRRGWVDEARVIAVEERHRELLALLPTEPCITEGIPNQLAAAEAEFGAFEQVAEILGVTLPYGSPPVG